MIMTKTKSRKEIAQIKAQAKAAVLAMPPRQVRDRTKGKPLKPEDAKVIRTFVAKPTKKNADLLTSVHYVLQRSDAAVVDARAAGLVPSLLVPLLGEKPTGTRPFMGRPARIAAVCLWLLLRDRPSSDPDLATLVDLLASKDKSVREHAAFAHGRLLLSRADVASFVALYGKSDAAVQTGLLLALRWRIGAAVSDEEHPPSDAEVARLEPVIGAALASRAHCALALESLQQLSWRIHADVTPFIPHVVGVLDGGKPAAVVDALNVLKDHVNASRRRSSITRDVSRAIALVVAHSRALPGKQKVTEVQIAARYALSAYQSIAENLGPADRKRIEQAFKKVAHIA